MASVLHDPFTEYLEVTDFSILPSPPTPLLTVNDTRDESTKPAVQVRVSVPRTVIGPDNLLQEQTRHVGACVLVREGSSHLRVRYLELLLENCLGKVLAAAVSKVVDEPTPTLVKIRKGACSTAPSTKGGKDAFFPEIPSEGEDYVISLCASETG